MKTPLSSVISTSSSHAYAVIVLPVGKTLDLHGGSSSSQKSAPPLPKNLAALRFSGALFIDRVEKSCAFAYRVTSAFPFHAFTLFKGEGGPLAVDEGCSVFIICRSA